MRTLVTLLALSELGPVSGESLAIPCSFSGSTFKPKRRLAAAAFVGVVFLVNCASALAWSRLRLRFILLERDVVFCTAVLAVGRFAFVARVFLVFGLSFLVPDSVEVVSVAEGCWMDDMLLFTIT